MVHSTSTEAVIAPVWLLRVKCHFSNSWFPGLLSCPIDIGLPSPNEFQVVTNNSFLNDVIPAATEFLCWIGEYFLRRL